MHANHSEWTTDLIQALNQLARLHKFDWEKIAIQLVESDLYSQVYPEITPTTCRMKFAQFNSVEVVKVEKENNYPMNEPSETIMTSKSTDILTSYQNMSIEELMITVEKNEREMELKKEKIFQRVLDSLGEFELSPSDTQRIIQADPAITAYREARLKKQELERLQQLKQEEQFEKERLERERLALRRRFDPDSEDAIGEYPEFLHFTSQHTSQFEQPTLLEGKMEEYKPFYHLQPPLEEREAQFINSFSMQNFIHGEEFDQILCELEKELESQAMGKECAEPSELGEVLKFLEESVEGATHGKSHRHQHHSLREEADHSDHILEESRKLAQEYTQAMAMLRTETSLSPSTHSPTPLVTSPTPAAATINKDVQNTPEPTVAANQATEIKPQRGETGSGRMSYGLANPSSHRPEAKKSKQSESDEDDDEDDDDDENGNQSWRNKRNRMKVQAQRRVEEQRHTEDISPVVSNPSPVLSQSSLPVATASPREPEQMIAIPQPATNAPIVDTQVKEQETPQEPSPSQISVIPSENQEILKATELLLEEIVPFIEVESIPNASGSLLSTANRHRTKGGKKK